MSDGTTAKKYGMAPDGATVAAETTLYPLGHPRPFYGQAWYISFGKYLPWSPALENVTCKRHARTLAVEKPHTWNKDRGSRIDRPFLKVAVAGVQEKIWNIFLFFFFF